MDLHVSEYRACERQRGEQGSSIGLWYTRNSLI